MAENSTTVTVNTSAANYTTPQRTPGTGERWGYVRVTNLGANVVWVRTKTSAQTGVVAVAAADENDPVLSGGFIHVPWTDTLTMIAVGGASQVHLRGITQVTVQG